MDNFRIENHKFETRQPLPYSHILVLKFNKKRKKIKTESLPRSLFIGKRRQIFRSFVSFSLSLSLHIVTYPSNLEFFRSILLYLYGDAHDVGNNRKDRDMCFQCACAQIHIRLSIED